MRAERRGGGAAAKMESAALVAPVTALEFAGDALLAGERRDRAGTGPGPGPGRAAGPAAADAVSCRHGPGGGGVPAERRRAGGGGGAAERAA